MKSQLIDSARLRHPKEDASKNLINGMDCESFAASRLLACCRGEVSWGSSAEDDSKVDFFLSIKSPIGEAARIKVPCQIKSGQSYGEIISDRAVIKSRALKEAKRAESAVCLLWVDRSASRVFWCYVTPSMKVGKIKLPRWHELNPATKFDLARCIAVERSARGTCLGGRGLIIKAPNPILVEARRSAKSQYRDLKSMDSYLLGQVEATNLGWRHMFRAGRKSAYKISSIALIAYLRSILLHEPSRQVILSSKVSSLGRFTHRTQEHLWVYTHALLSSGRGGNSRISIYLRVIEEVCYPANWQMESMLSQQVKRRSVIKSLYYKPSA